MAAGPRFSLVPRSRSTPFIFLEGGEVRISTKANSIKDRNPVAKGGLGMDIKVSGSFGI